MRKLIMNTALSVMFTMPAMGHAASLYFDRDSYIVDTNPQAFVDFNDVPLGSSYAGQELGVGPIRLSGGVRFGLPVNNIAPWDGCEQQYTIDGTPHACSWVDLENELRMDFLAPVVSWGTDLNDIGNDTRETLLRVWDTEESLVHEYLFQDGVLAENSFFGIDAGDTVLSHVTFSFVQAGPDAFFQEDYFSLDNMLFTTNRGDDGGPRDPVAPVPLPAPFLMLGSAAIGLFGLRKRRKTSSQA